MSLRHTHMHNFTGPFIMDTCSRLCYFKRFIFWYFLRQYFQRV